MNKDETQRKIDQVLNQQPSDMEYLLLKIEKLGAGEKGKTAERWLTSIGGLGVINLYVFTLLNELSHWYFTIFLAGFIIMIIERNLQMRNDIDEQIILLTKALRKIQDDQSELRK
jgi:hypothetical protein